MYIFGPFNCEFQIKELFKLTTKRNHESLWKLSGSEIIWNQPRELSDYNESRSSFLVCSSRLWSRFEVHMISVIFKSNRANIKLL